MSPFRSKAQQKYMFAKHPKIAKEFASKTKDFKKLPEHSIVSELTKRGLKKK